MRTTTFTVVAIVAALNVLPAVAKNDHKKGSSGGEPGVSVEIRIDQPQRVVIQDYYSSRVASGHCPPGLAKKNNGCMPPGQAKKWAKGRPLPRDVVFYDLPPDLSVRLSAPAGYKYVRVAADVLMIAVGTGLVVDALEDLGRI